MFMTHHILLHKCFGQNTKHNGVQGLSKPYNIILDTKMGHGKSDMQQITCTCVACNSM